GTAPLRIERVLLTPPLRLDSMGAQIAPGTDATLRVTLDPAKLSGHFAGHVVVYTNDPAAPEVVLSIGAEVIPPIELAPVAAFFLAGVRGRDAVTWIDIVNHEDWPIELAAPHHSPTHFTSRVETIEPGQRYRLWIALKSDGPVGKHQEEITVATSSKSVPVLTIPANTLLRERVYTFPEAVDLGALPLAAIRANPHLPQQNAQVLMVYQSDGRDFRISATSDIPGLSIRTERAASGDRHQLTIALDPARPLAAGVIQGTIVIDTNDPEFPTVRVPVSGALLGDG
ncbi:MAG TPA: hypothetical protein VFN64_02780, partial [Burkholderiaceae bacterium]|nr:hypothetical protein [Burkholderiaceae bacterium]